MKLTQQNHASNFQLRQTWAGIFHKLNGIQPDWLIFFYSVSQDTDKDIIANLLETAGKQDSTSTGFYNPQISQSSTPAQTEPLPLRSQKLTILEKRNPVFSKEKDDLLKALDFLD